MNVTFRNGLHIDLTRLYTSPKSHRSVGFWGDAVSRRKLAQSTHNAWAKLTFKQRKARAAAISEGGKRAVERRRLLAQPK